MVYKTVKAIQQKKKFFFFSLGVKVKQISVTDITKLQQLSTTVLSLCPYECICVISCIATFFFFFFQQRFSEQMKGKRMKQK